MSGCVCLHMQACLSEKELSLVPYAADQNFLAPGGKPKVTVTPWSLGADLPTFPKTGCANFPVVLYDSETTCMGLLGEGQCQVTDQ